ncbi:capsular polysaccharide export protein, LipB/KpsS family [Hanstruepera flava]|uniref:capsular polysaccharide export protein, LipB/KpsS family n=1 Tax=Hanstruepera flava TaxID=2930218 RepID=UPI0020277813|nr:hypothetical protein [Hanstruepera flava]
MKKMTVGLKDLDKQAYDIVCNWYKYTGFNPVYNGIDYSHIIRFYLWDKVGRALRIKHGIDYGEVEFYRKEYKSYPQYYTPVISKGSFKKSFLSRNKIVFIPFQSHYTQKIIHELQLTKGVKVISKVSGGILSKKNIIKPKKYNFDSVWNDTLYNQLIRGLNEQGLCLIPEDVLLLKEQISGVVAMTSLAIAELKDNKPHAVFVHSDNHPPFINYVLAARKLGIPTFTYQHGLDCEYYYYDDCFADFIGVWSNHRKKMYELNSVMQPKSFKVCGNIFLSKQPECKEVGLNKILFITRPHKSLKCYSPSRSHKEGLNILNVILEYLRENKHIELVIKPHPMDLVSLYDDAIEQSGLHERVKIKESILSELLCESTVVVTEDSTAGVEAMRFGIPVIHANLSEVEPLLPLVDGQSALKGFSEVELLQNLETAFNLGSHEKKMMYLRQKEMVEMLIPEGQVEAVTNYILENI